MKPITRVNGPDWKAQSFCAPVKALSLIEVLIAVAVISVAIYGIIMTLGAQQISEEQMRDTKVLKQLHYQLVREILKNQRDQDHYVNPSNVYYNLLIPPSPTGSYPIQMTNPALGQDIIYFNASSLGNNVYNSSVHTERYNSSTGIAQTLARSSITVYLPYTNWQSVKP